MCKDRRNEQRDPSKFKAGRPLHKVGASVIDHVSVSSPNSQIGTLTPKVWHLGMRYWGWIRSLQGALLRGPEPFQEETQESWLSIPPPVSAWGVGGPLQARTPALLGDGLAALGLALTSGG